MKFSVVAAAILTFVPAILGLTINTPTNVVVCQPILLSWSGGTAPYFLSLVPAGQVSATPLKSFDSQQGTQLTWTVDLQANTGFTIVLKDNTGAVAYSDIVTVQAGSDISCLTSGSSDVSSPSGTNSGASSPANTGTSTSASKPPNSSGGSGTSTGTSSTSTRSNGAVSGLAFSSFGVAGVIGAIAALF